MRIRIMKTYDDRYVYQNYCLYWEIPYFFFWRRWEPVCRSTPEGDLCVLYFETEAEAEKAAESLIPQGYREPTLVREIVI